MKRLICFLLFCIYLQTSYADFGVALGDKPKYKNNFSHFDYVNPFAPKGGVLTIPMTGSFDSLNPFSLKGDHEAGISMLTLDTLMEQSDDEAFSVYGLIADDIQLAKDELSVRFHINPNARFHNGDKVEASDVVYSFQTLTQDKAATPFYRLYWGGVKNVQIIDNHTVQFNFKEKNSELHLILGQLPIFSHKSFPNGLKDGNAQPIGSGPYKLQRILTGRLSEFVRDKQYWAENLPTRRGMFNFDTVRLKYYQDETARVEALKAGEFDVLEENVARLWARAYSDNVLNKRKLVRKTFTHENNAGMQGFVMNLRRPLLQNKALRRALVEAFDFESVNRQLFYGLYKRDNSFFTNTELAAQGLPENKEYDILLSVKDKLPPEIFTTNAIDPPITDKERGIRPNLLRARALLEKNGYRYHNGYLVDKNNQKIELEFLTYSKTFERVTAKWRRDLKKIGITLNIRVIDAALFQKRLNEFDYDITIVSYANSQSPGNEQYNFHSCTAAKTNGTNNYSGICNPAIEGILPYFVTSKNREELVAASRALDRVLRSQYIVVPNWYSDSIRMIVKDNLDYPKRLPRYYHGLSWAIKTWWIKD